MDVPEHKKRFSIIKKMGINEKDINRIINRQIGM